MVDTKISGLTGGPSYEHNRLERTAQTRAEGGGGGGGEEAGELGPVRWGGREPPPRSRALLLGGSGPPPQQQRSAAGGVRPPPLAAGMALDVQGGYRAVCGRSYISLEDLESECGIRYRGAPGGVEI